MGRTLPAESAPRSPGEQHVGGCTGLGASAGVRPPPPDGLVGAGSVLGTCLGAAGRSPGPSRRLPPAGLWTFLWFIGFCFLTNQWAWTQAKDVHVGADSARAAITFSFFSIFSWVSEAVVEPSSAPLRRERGGAPRATQPRAALTPMVPLSL